jgi:hypothetical protein
MVVRHVDEFGLAYRHQGLLVTSPARTVVDLARTGSLANAVAAADRAVRVGSCDKSELWSEARDVAPRSRGRHRGLLLADLVDGRSMSPGESLSRVQMFVLNLLRSDLQVKCEDESGLIGYGDFGWDGVVGEFDGKVKYRVPEGSSAQEAARVLWAEKRREAASGPRGRAWLAGSMPTRCTPSAWPSDSPSRGSGRPHARFDLGRERRLTAGPFPQWRSLW